MSAVLKSDSITTISLPTLTAEELAEFQAECKEFEFEETCRRQFPPVFLPAYVNEKIEEAKAAGFDPDTYPRARVGPNGAVQWHGVKDGKPHTLPCAMYAPVAVGLLDPAAQEARHKEIARESEAWLDLPESPYRVMLADEFSENLKSLEWWVKSFLQVNARLVTLYAAPGDGKSFLALDLLTAIHRGGPWHGRKVKRGRVVYVCAEGEDDFRYRYKAYQYAHEIDACDMPPVIAAAPNLFHIDIALEVTKQVVAAGGCDLICFDTLSATSAGMDENSSEMGVYWDNVKKIQRALDCTCIVVTHVGKERGRGMRGHSSQLGTVDAAIEIERNGEVRTATVRKSKGGREGATFTFRLREIELGHDADGEPYGSCVVEETQTVVEVPARKPPSTRWGKRIYNALSEAPGQSMSLAALNQALSDAHPDTTRDERRSIQPAIKRLIEQNYLTQNGEQLTLVPPDDGF